MFKDQDACDATREWHEEPEAPEAAAPLVFPSLGPHRLFLEGVMLQSADCLPLFSFTHTIHTALENVSWVHHVLPASWRERPIAQLKTGIHYRPIQLCHVL